MNMDDDLLADDDIFKDDGLEDIDLDEAALLGSSDEEIADPEKNYTHREHVEMRNLQLNKKMPGRGDVPDAPDDDVLEVDVDADLDADPEDVKTPSRKTLIKRQSGCIKESQSIVSPNTSDESSEKIIGVSSEERNVDGESPLAIQDSLNALDDDEESSDDDHRERFRSERSNIIALTPAKRRSGIPDSLDSILSNEEVSKAQAFMENQQRKKYFKPGFTVKDKAQRNQKISDVSEQTNIRSTAPKKILINPHFKSDGKHGTVGDPHHDVNLCGLDAVAPPHINMYPTSGSSFTAHQMPGPPHFSGETPFPPSIHANQIFSESCSGFVPDVNSRVVSNTAYMSLPPPNYGVPQISHANVIPNVQTTSASQTLLVHPSEQDYQNAWHGQVNFTTPPPLPQVAATMPPGSGTFQRPIGSAISLPIPSLASQYVGDIAPVSFQNEPNPPWMSCYNEPPPIEEEKKSSIQQQNWIPGGYGNQGRMKSSVQEYHQQQQYSSTQLNLKNEPHPMKRVIKRVGKYAQKVHSLKQMRLDESSKKIIHVRKYNSNIKEIPLLENIPPELEVPHTEKSYLDEEEKKTEELCKKIEEQKKLREQILKRKEERRREMAAMRMHQLKNRASSNEQTSMKSVNSTAETENEGCANKQFQKKLCGLQRNPIAGFKKVLTIQDRIGSKKQFLQRKVLSKKISLNAPAGPFKSHKLPPSAAQKQNVLPSSLQGSQFGIGVKPPKTPVSSSGFANNFQQIAVKPVGAINDNVSSASSSGGASEKTVVPSSMTCAVVSKASSIQSQRMSPLPQKQVPRSKNHPKFPLAHQIRHNRVSTQSLSQRNVLPFASQMCRPRMDQNFQIRGNSPRNGGFENIHPRPSHPSLSPLLPLPTFEFRDPRHGVFPTFHPAQRQFLDNRIRNFECPPFMAPPSEYHHQHISNPPPRFPSQMMQARFRNFHPHHQNFMPRHPECFASHQHPRNVIPARFPISEKRLDNKNSVTINSWKSRIHHSARTSEQTESRMNKSKETCVMASEKDSSNKIPQLIDPKGDAPTQDCLGSTIAVVHNLSSSTSKESLKKLGTSVGPVKEIHLNVVERQASVEFMEAVHAVEFKEKYQRYMLDLSMIEVTLKPS